MKFYCENCNTKYGIADEKVRGKVLKVRCKECGNIITVREHTAPADETAAKTTTPADPTRAQWHYSINGDSFGPFGFEALIKRFATGELGDECYVWTDSFAQWKPVREVDAFREGLASGQRIKPRSQTLGVSQALEAVEPEDDDSSNDDQQHDDPPNDDQQADDQQADDQQVDDQQADDQQADDQQADESRKDRLAELRARLNADSGSTADDAAGEEASKDAPSADSAEQAGAVTSEASALDDDLVADGGAPQVLAGEQDDERPAGQADPLGPTLPLGDMPEGDLSEISDDVGFFDGADGPEASGDPEPGAEDSDLIPFLSDDSEADSEHDDGEEAESASGSLLSELDSIQKQGRGKKVLLAVVAMVVVGGLVGLAVHFVGEVEPEERVAERDSAAADEADEDEGLVEHTYSADERNKILALGSPQGDDAGDDDQAGSQEDAQEAAAAAGGDEGPPAPAAEREPEKSDKKRAADLADNSSERDEAFDSATKKEGADEGLRNDIDDGRVAGAELDSPLAEGGSFGALADTGSERSEQIYKPTDSIKEREEEAAGGMKLSREQISQSMSTVRRSVGLCRQRHSRRGAKLEARKIYLTLTVEPTGRVSGFTLDPERLRHTEFDKCMNSHLGRWKFPTFQGSSQKMRAPFVLQ